MCALAILRASESGGALHSAWKLEVPPGAAVSVCIANYQRVAPLVGKLFHEFGPFLRCANARFFTGGWASFGAIGGFVPSRNKNRETYAWLV